MRRLAALAVVGVLALAGCHDHPNPNPTPSSSPSASPTASPSVSPSASPSVSPSVSPSASPSMTPSPPAGGFPNASTTGASVETGLPAGPCSLDAGQTYTGMLFDCDKLEMRAGTVVRDSVVLGEVKGDSTGAPFVLERTTIRGTGCEGKAAIGNSNYIARHVEVTGFVDAFRAEWGVVPSASNPQKTVTIEDSYAVTCHVGDSHGDGLQGYNARDRIVFRHNTVDMPGVGGTAPLFWGDGSSSGGVFVDNLLSGGSYTMRVQSGSGHTVTGNRVVDRAWEFGPADCAGGSYATWSDNRLVTLGTNYSIASTLGEVRC